MIGCKVMRTLASVEIEIMLILGLPCCLSSSSVRCLENVVPVPLPEDPYEAIRHAYLDGMDTKSVPFKDPVETETPEAPHTVAPPTSLPEGTPPTLVSILRRTARMAVRVPLAMSPSLSASMVEVAAMSDFTFRKRFRSSYESSPSSSPPDLPLRKRYQGTSELVGEDKEEEEDEEIEESLGSDSVSNDAEDESPTTEDEDPAARDEGLATGDEGLRDEEEAILEGQQRAVLIVGAAVSAPLGLGYGELRRRELALEEDHVYCTFEVGQGYGFAPKPEIPERVSASRQPTLTTWTDPKDSIVYIDVPTCPPPALPAQTPPSPEWSSGSLPISPTPSVIPSPISSPMIPLTIPSPVASPATAETEGFLTELGAQVEMQRGLIRDHTVRLEELSPTLFKRSPEHQQERITVTFGAIWRPLLALESWEENQELRLHLAEERRARLELAEIVDNMSRGKEPKGDV
ncbi:hypothetical protein Tco_1508215 [Tanacetum coccineum]